MSDNFLSYYDYAMVVVGSCKPVNLFAMVLVAAVVSKCSVLSH